MVLDCAVVQGQNIGQLIEIVGPVLEKFDYLYPVLTAFLAENQMRERSFYRGDVNQTP
jgi:hypothetical protein